MDKIFNRKKVYHPNTLILAVYVASIFYSLHYAITVYLNSTFLEQFLESKLIGYVYITVAILSIFIAFKVSHLLNRFKNYKVVIWSALLEIGCLYALSVSTSLASAITFFIIQQILVDIIFISLNITVEEISKTGNTGSIRGVFMTILNLGVLAAALFSGIIYEWLQFPGIFRISALFLLPVIYISWKYTHSIFEPKYKVASFLNSLKHIFKNKDVLRIMIIQFILGIFYSVMVVYGLTHIHEISQIEHSTILKIIMPIALLPFVIFPFELGVLADSKFGEKEILNIGLVVAGFSTLLIPFVHSKDIFIWTLILFTTRVGASFIETMTNIYFYKKIHKEESDVIVFFNSLSRVSLIFVSLVAILFLQVLNLPLYSLFIFASFALFIGLIFGSKINDTL
jgi:MFS family permease